MAIKAAGATATKTEDSKQSKKRVPKPSGERGAKQAGVTLGQRFYAWLDNHRRVSAEALLRLLSRPASSMLTWLMLGIAMALPAGLYVVLNNIEVAAGGWGGNAKVTVYFHEGVSAQQATDMQAELETHRLVAEISYLSEQDALEEFQQISGFGDILATLPNNPLPSLLELKLQSNIISTASVQALQDELNQDRRVESAQVDLSWVQRLQAILELARQGVLILAVMLGVAVLLVTGNTIRLEIESRREEIIITKLVGGTNAFVRRPLLYTGMWYGLGGAIVAVIIVFLSTWLLAQPAAALVGLYDYSFAIKYLSFEATGWLFIGGAVLGLLGAWLAVGRHIAAIEPK